MKTVWLDSKGKEITGRLTVRKLKKAGYAVRRKPKKGTT